MDEVTGTTVDDAASSGGDSDLELSGQFSWDDGYAGSPNNVGLYSPNDCNTSCDTYIYPNDLSQQVTVSAWVKPTKVDTEGTYIVSMPYRFFLRFSSTTGAAFGGFTEDSSWQETLAAVEDGNTVIDGQWHHIEGIYDGTQDANGNGTVYLYWDGELVDTTNFAVDAGGKGFWSSNNDEGVICLGASEPDHQTTNFSGYIDDVIIRNAADTWTELTYDDFEVDFGNYTDGGNECFLYTGTTYAHGGDNAADIQDDRGDNSSFYHTSGIDVSAAGYTQVKVDFWYYPVSFDNANEDFWVLYYDGSSWKTVLDFDYSIDFSNDSFYHGAVYIHEDDYTFPSDMKIKFTCDASGDQDDAYIDNIEVSAR